jgi:hypothetical protein
MKDVEETGHHQILGTLLAFAWKERRKQQSKASRFWRQYSKRVMVKVKVKLFL